MNVYRNRIIQWCLTVTCLSAAAADELLWQGNAGTGWNTTEQNWLNGAEPSAFLPGADARFDDTAASPAVTLSGSQQAGQVLFDTALGYTLAGNALTQAALLIKRGDGELTITGKGHTFAGDIIIENGTLTTTADNDAKNIAAGPLGNPRVPRTITVLKGGTLNFASKNPFGGGTSTTPILTDIRVIGGTFNLTTNFGNNLGSLYLDNATFNYSGGHGNHNPGGRNWGFSIGSNLTLKGDAPYVFDQRGSVQCQFNFGKYQPTDIWVDDITGDDAPDAVFQVPIYNVSHSNLDNNRDGIETRFNKLGPGTLELASSSNDYTGDVHIVEGTLVASINRTTINPNSSALGNPRVPHRLVVETNAALVFATSDIMGQAWAYPQIEIEVNGGTLVQASGHANVFGPLILDNATLVYSGRKGDWGTMILDGDVTFRGGAPYDLTEIDGSRLRCGYNRMTFFNVEDITGDDAPDVTISMQINDCIAWNAYPARPSRFGKRGAGTLRLANHGSTFTGDIEISGGILQAPTGGNGENKTTSCLGNPQSADRAITVHSGGELFFQSSDTLGQLASWLKVGLVVSNGTFRNGNNVCNAFGPLTLHDATVIYNGGAASTRRWGTLGFGERVTVSGTRPQTFPVIGSNCAFSLGYATGMRTETVGDGTTNIIGQTEFIIHDITGDEAADTTFGVPLQDIPDWPSTRIFQNTFFKCGLLKSGAGTLRLASTANTYTGPTTVTQGVLRVDGALTASAVTVAAGGWLGGTGTVASVTLEDGAGFETLVGQTEPLKIAALATAGGAVTVRVRNPSELDVTAVNVPFAKLAAPCDVSRWTVLVDGAAPTPNLRVRIGADGTAYAGWSPKGTVFILR